MATIVNNPGTGSDSGASGWIVAAVVIIGIVLVALFVWPGFAGFGGGGDTTNVDVSIPAPTGGGGGGAAGPQ